MLVLSEGLAKDSDTTSSKLLVDLGVNVPQVGNHNIPKKAPHEKYYWNDLNVKYFINIHHFIK